jgi:membrane protein implicated in regulation of membrane protease activity
MSNRTLAIAMLATLVAVWIGIFATRPAEGASASGIESELTGYAFLALSFFVVVAARRFLRRQHNSGPI